MKGHAQNVLLKAPEGCHEAEKLKASEAGVFDNHHQILRKKDAWESRVGFYFDSVLDL